MITLPEPVGAKKRVRVAAMSGSVKVLFVCMGNICRSPSAEGVFRKLVESEGLSESVIIDSAGTHDYNIGSPPDPRAQSAARRRGIDLSGQRARRARPGDFRRFDYILAMDRDNRADLADICPPGEEHRLRMFLEFAPHLEWRDVPDPYSSGVLAFEFVLDLLEAAAVGLLANIRQHHF